MAVPRPLASHNPHPAQLQGDYEKAEMSFASSLTEEELRDPGREILVMNVDLGNGHRDKLVVHEQDVPEALAAEFCRKHGLGERLVQALAVNIRGNLDQLDDEERGEEHRTEQDRTEEDRAEEDRAEEDRAEESRTEREKPESPKKQGQRTLPRSFLYRQTVGRSANVGERLYTKGVMMKGSMEVQLNRARHNLQLSQQQELTFAPKLNPVSCQPRTEESPLLQAQLSQRLLDQKRHEAIVKQAAECTFQPATCPRSEAIDRKKAREGSRFEVLYHHAEVKRAKAEQLTEKYLRTNYPFKPTLETKAELEPVMTHVEKMHTSRKLIETQLDKQRIKLMGKWDPQTGAELYKPKIGRPPQQHRDKKTPIGEYLHTIQPVRAEPVLPNADISQFIVSRPQSEQMYEKMKRARFTEIFSVLKDATEEVVRPETADAQRLGTPLASVLSPLLSELELMGETLDIEEFCASMDSLMKSLSPTEKAIVLRKTDTAESAKESASKDSFKRSQSVGLMRDMSLYDREILRIKALEERLREEKAHCDSLKTAECSFRPAITPYDPLRHTDAPLTEFLHEAKGESLKPNTIQ